MKISFFTVGGQVLGPIENKLREKGIEVLTNTCDENCDFIFLGTVSVVSSIIPYINKYPNIPLIVYNWDQYGWHHHQGYAWGDFNKLQQHSKEIWTPSTSVNLRVEEYLGLGNKCFIIKCFARLFDYPIDQIKDNRYVAHVIRDYNYDPQFDWGRKACNELNIPIDLNDNHHRSEEGFQKWLAEATLLLNPYDEASTGGLSLIEGYKLGKPVLVCDSPYMGAKEYFEDKATYFERGNYQDFKEKLSKMFFTPSFHDIKECEQFTKQYELEVMVDNIIKRLKDLKK